MTNGHWRRSLMEFITARSILLSEFLGSAQLAKDMYNYVWQPPMQKGQILTAQTIVDRLQELGGNDHCTCMAFL